MTNSFSFGKLRPATRILLLAGALLLVGCGGGNDEDTGAAAAQPAPTADAPAPGASVPASPAPAPAPGAAAPAPAPAQTPAPAADATAVGVPMGNAVSATIGAAGGSLSAPDGKLVLTVPPGALALDTVIAIQPYSNTAHGKRGSAYRLTPEGQIFLKPVTLSFAYTEQDVSGTAVEALGAAFQTASGHWQWAGDAVVNSMAKTFSVATTHFSVWSAVTGLQLVPSSKVVKVKASLVLRVVVCYQPPPSQWTPAIGSSV